MIGKVQKNQLWLTDDSSGMYGIGLLKHRMISMTPVREKVLIGIREEERSMNVVVSDYKKEQAIKAARLTAPPKERKLNLRKFYRIYGA